MSEFDIILASGCSNTYGAETVKDGDDTHPECINNCYGKFIQNKLNIPHYVNVAKSGYSNFSIAFSCISELRKLLLKYKKEKILVVVGWTEPQRFTIRVREKYLNLSTLSIHKLFRPEKERKSFCENSNRMIEYIKLIPNLAEFLKNLFIFYLNTDLALKQDYLTRLGVDCILRSSGVKYFTFPTLDELIFDEYYFYRSFLEKNNNLFTFKEKSWINLEESEKSSSYFNQFKLIFSNFYSRKEIKIENGEVQNYKFFDHHYSNRDFSAMNMFKKYGVSSSGGHLKRDAHEKLAEFLIDSMFERGIIVKK